MPIIRIYIIFLFTASICNGQGFNLNNYIVHHIGVENGLSQGTVYTMLKDSKGLMWFTSYEGLNCYDGKNMKVFTHDPKKEKTFRGSNSIGLVEDSLQNIWTGSEQCLNQYIRAEDNFEYVFANDLQGRRIQCDHYPFHTTSDEVWYINSIEGIMAYNYRTGEKHCIHPDFLYKRSNSVINSTIAEGDEYIWTRLEKGVVRIDVTTKQTRYFFSDHPKNILGTPTQIMCIFKDRAGIFWLASVDRVFRLDLQNQKVKTIALDIFTNSFLTDIREDATGQFLFLGSGNEGLLILDKQTLVLRQISAQTSPLHLSNNSPITLYSDRNSILWMNTDPTGIDVLITDFYPFKGEAISQKLSTGVRCFAEAKDGKIWIGLQSGTLVLFDPTRNKIEKEVVFPVFQPDYLTALKVTKTGDVWIATSQSLFRYGSNDMTRFVNKAGLGDYFNSNFIWDIEVINSGELLVATDLGYYLFNMANGDFHAVEKMGKIVGGKIFKDRSGRLFLSQSFNGFHLFKPGELKKNSGHAGLHFLSTYNFKCFYEGAEENILWAGTNTGLLKIYHRADWSAIDSVSQFTIEDGLGSNYIYGILQDEKGDLWMSHNHGISRLEIDKERFINFGPEHKLQGLEYNTNAFLKTTKGWLFFGGVNGFNYFFPNKIKTNPHPPENIIIRKLKINGNISNTLGNPDFISKLDLKHFENTFELSFSAIDFFSNGDNQYMACLEGYDKDWINLSARDYIRYTNVPSGDYILQLKAANSDGVFMENAKRIRIHIRTPWWRQLWFYFLMTFIVASIFYWLYRNALARKLANQQTLRLRETNDLKNRLITNITHEFRTPLTVIEGMACELVEAPSVNPKKKAGLIKKNSRRLLNLVNQMLELAKLEHKDNAPNWVQDDIIPSLSYITDAYSSQASGKNISLQFYAETPTVLMDFDLERTRKILHNLISNALKFTLKYGKVLVLAKKEGSSLFIKVIDSGIGISPEHLPNIFSRFYRADESGNVEGSGIGLAIAKEMTALLGGKISVESRLGKGSTFMVELPITNTAPLQKTFLDAPLQNQTDNPFSESSISGLLFDQNKPLALIVEDNADLIYYLKNCLSASYNVLVARSGEEGIQSAFSSIPDIIISDVMMPRKDGYELCETLKSDLRTSHVPIILLTAKADEKSKLAGLERGADAYLKKPFSKEELLLRMSKLIELRKKLLAHFADMNPLKKKQTEGFSQEDQFMTNLLNVLAEHIGDTHFSTPQLCQKMAMSRTQLYRKLKALTGISVATYIRKYRLNHARHLLDTTDMRIAEIALNCGFENFSWFAQAFKEEFGVAASELRK